MKRLVRFLLLLLLALALALTFILIWDHAHAPKDETEPVPNPVATILLKRGGTITIELYPNTAPNTVASFIHLANSGFYDGQDFYRVINGAFIQAGSPTGDRTGAASYTIEGEFLANGFRNNLHHTRGVISMARSDDYNSASSQFFILQGDYPDYDGQYAAFGMLTGQESFDLLDQIGSSAVDSYATPVRRWVISRIRVDTFGAEYEYTEYVSPDEENEEETE